MLKNLKFIILLACSVFLFACAEEKDESNASIQRRILEAYLEVNYPNKNYTITKSGLVILEHEEGEGIYPEDQEAAYANYSVKKLDGNYQSTNVESVAKQLGTYDKSKYFGPELLEIGFGKIVDGLHEALCMMNKGSRMTVIVPPELSAKDYSDIYNVGGYTTEKTQTSEANLIYEIEMGNVITNIVKFQIDSLESFKNMHYPGLDSLENGFYFKKLSGVSKDTIPEGNKADVWYVGRLLDGYVFDTNIKDTAIKYGLYDASSDYEPMEVTYKATYGAMSDDNSSNSSSGATDADGGSYVSGFAKALKSMTYGDRAITFFGYDWGYGSTSTMSDGKGIPSYSMLFFDLYIEKKSEL